MLLYQSTTKIYTYTPWMNLVLWFDIWSLRVYCTSCTSQRAFLISCIDIGARKHTHLLLYREMCFFTYTFFNIVQAKLLQGKLALKYY